LHTGDVKGVFGYAGNVWTFGLYFCLLSDSDLAMQSSKPLLNYYSHQCQAEIVCVLYLIYGMHVMSYSIISGAE